MSRTQNQQMGDAHEADIAEWIGGSVQKASGNQWHRQGDAKNGEHLVAYPITADGKSTMGTSISVTRAMWRKIVEQTFNQHPAVFLRFYRPGTHPWQVDTDLAVIGAGLFAELLEGARKWAAIEEEIGDDNAIEVEHVIALLRAGRDRQNEALQDLIHYDEDLGLYENGLKTVAKPDVQHRTPVLDGRSDGVHPVQYMGGHKTGNGVGCDCCR